MTHSGTSVRRWRTSAVRPIPVHSPASPDLPKPDIDQVTFPHSPVVGVGANLRSLALRANQLMLLCLVTARQRLWGVTQMN